jgi:uncharacterized protein YceH (UPF0502 family)
MKTLLTPIEVRVFGSLLEKELTTPEGYPLSLAALTAASNQKSSREPVMNLEEATVLDVVNALMKKHMVRESGGSGSRVPKYAHRFSVTLNPVEELSQKERALLSLLMLRGPQTLGELRTRSTRMYEFRDLEEVAQTLLELANRPDGAYVAELPRQPGQRERRFMQLWSGDEVPATSTIPVENPATAETPERMAALEEEVCILRQELADLRLIVEALTRS